MIPRFDVGTAGLPDPVRHDHVVPPAAAPPYFGVPPSPLSVYAPLAPVGRGFVDGLADRHRGPDLAGALPLYPVPPPGLSRDAKRAYWAAGFAVVVLAGLVATSKAGGS